MNKITILLLGILTLPLTNDHIIYGASSNMQEPADLNDCKLHERVSLAEDDEWHSFRIISEDVLEAKGIGYRDTNPDSHSDNKKGAIIASIAIAFRNFFLGVDDLKSFAQDYELAVNGKDKAKRDRFLQQENRYKEALKASPLFNTVERIDKVRDNIINRRYMGQLNFNGLNVRIKSDLVLRGVLVDSDIVSLSIRDNQKQIDIEVNNYRLVNSNAIKYYKEICRLLNSHVKASFITDTPSAVDCILTYRRK